MTNIALIIETGATPSSVTATLDMVRVANRFLGDDILNLQLLSAAGGPIALAEMISVTTLPMPETLTHFDAVILPGFFAVDFPSVCGQLQTAWQPAIARLRRVRGGETLVAASCYGTFTLAESGLLDDCIATTTWWFQREFGQRYPQVRLQADKALADDGLVLTAGAMTAHVGLTMQVLRRLKGDELAHNVASIMLVDEARRSQRPFVMLQTTFTDPLVQNAVDWMREHQAESWAAQILAEACRTTYRTLHRRFSTAAGMPPLEYLQCLRVERGKKLLEATSMSLEQIVGAVGYNDVSSFRRLFSRHVGLSPAQYRRRFRHTPQD